MTGAAVAIYGKTNSSDTYSLVGCSMDIIASLQAQFIEITDPLRPFSTRRVPNGMQWDISASMVVDYTGKLVEFQEDTLSGKYVYLKILAEDNTGYVIYEGIASIKNIKEIGKVGEVMAYELSAYSNSGLSPTSTIPVIPPTTPPDIVENFLQNATGDYIMSSNGDFIQVN